MGTPTQTLELVAGGSYYCWFAQGDEVYDFTGAALVALATATTSRCRKAVTQIGSTKFYKPADPTGLPSGDWTRYVSKKSSGAEALQTDANVWEDDGTWDGSAWTSGASGGAGDASEASVQKVLKVVQAQRRT